MSDGSERVVLCYGDSNTHGTMPMETLADLGRFGPRERWPGVMAASLGAGWRVIEEGHPGRTTVHPDPVAGVYKNGSAVLPAILESHRPIDLVAIMLGTNDLKQRFQVPAVEIAISIEKLVLCVRQSYAGPGGAAPRVLVICPPAVLETGCLGDVFGGGAAKSGQVAGFLEPIAARNGAGFLDAGEIVSPSPLDGVHLDAAAHAALGRAVADAVAGSFGGGGR
jgi:lysophospholipase L1-like esterase